ncbi:glycosyl transferase family 2, partial [Streptomyces sp. NRRL S-444]
DVGYVRGADQAFYRVHGNNMSTTDFGGQLDDLRQRLVAFDSVLEKCSGLLPEAGRLSALARTRLARYALRRAYRAYDRGRTGVVPVEELEAFAAECLPEYTSLGEYRALRRRRRIGARVMP